jgi:hypothetical protein
MSDVTPAPEKKPTEVVAAGKNSEWWVGEVSRSFKGWRDYRDKAKKVLARYRDERKDSDSERKRFNILYSNTETMGPVVYSQAPVPDIRRRFQDKDDVARLTATILQRATQYSCEAYDFDGVLDRCKKDYLLPGFAVARVVYKPYFKQPPQKASQPAPGADPSRRPKCDRTAGGTAGAHLPGGRERIRPLGSLRHVPHAHLRARLVGGVADDLTKDEVKAQFGAHRRRAQLLRPA